LRIEARRRFIAGFQSVADIGQANAISANMVGIDRFAIV
jgi:hypothetical protein